MAILEKLSIQLKCESKQKYSTKIELFWISFPFFLTWLVFLFRFYDIWWMKYSSFYSAKIKAAAFNSVFIVFPFFFIFFQKHFVIGKICFHIIQWIELNVKLSHLKSLIKWTRKVDSENIS